ncbi:MAG: peptidylprolyl isomerase [Acidobacteria bacterium]|nr:peptidylprolyl isomerase [Acidobacteriota bacterium]MBI3423972.1 peptidylprolyl isomerase [Acidobacteriota bacterium]
MSAVQFGDTVKVHYTGTLTDGQMFDTSDGSDPLAFTVGAGQVIPGFDQALLGMQTGETKNIIIPPGEAYGEREAGLIQQLSRDQFRLGEIEPEVGMAIEMRTPEGHGIPMVITELTDAIVTLDANHPLAGETLHFALTLVEIAV